MIKLIYRYAGAVRHAGTLCWTGRNVGYIERLRGRDEGGAFFYIEIGDYEFADRMADVAPREEKLCCCYLENREAWLITSQVAADLFFVSCFPTTIKETSTVDIRRRV